MSKLKWFSKLIVRDDSGRMVGVSGLCNDVHYWIKGSYISCVGRHAGGGYGVLWEVESGLFVEDKYHKLYSEEDLRRDEARADADELDGVALRGTSQPKRRSL